MRSTLSAAEPRHAQEILAAGAVEVDREALAVLQRPGELGIEPELEHAAGTAGQDLLDREAVEAEQPVRLVEPVLRRSGGAWSGRAALESGIGLKAE